MTDAMCGGLGRIKGLNDGPVDIAGSHAELIDLGGHVTCVARHVLFVKVHLAVAGREEHFNLLSQIKRRTYTL